MLLYIKFFYDYLLAGYDIINLNQFAKKKKIISANPTIWRFLELRDFMLFEKPFV